MSTVGVRWMDDGPLWSTENSGSSLNQPYPHILWYDIKKAALAAARYPKMVSRFRNILHVLLQAKLIRTYGSFRNRLISSIHFLCHICLWPRQNIATKVRTARI